MKKKIAAILCALAICLGLTISFPANAAGNLCFMGINDTLLNLENRFIPITLNGQYYVPYTALDKNSTGLDLGIYPIYNSILNVLTIYNREQVMTFDLNSGFCTDRGGAGLPARAVTRNGQVYVPAKFVSQYFGLTFHNRMTNYGPMVRICNSSAKLDHDQFVDLSQMLMEDRLKEWIKNQIPDDPIVTPTPTPTPTITPSIGESVRTYLAFRGDRTEGLEDLLAYLEQYQTTALFFFPAEELARYDDAVRSVLCAGHAVGLLVSGDTAQEIAEQAGKGNQTLAQIAHLHTNSILAPDSSKTMRNELKKSGWLCWNTDVDALPNGESVSRQAETVMEQVNSYKQKVYVLSDTSMEGASLMTRVLYALKRDKYDMRLATETEI